MSQILGQIREKEGFEFTERLREGRLADFLKRTVGVTLFKRGAARKEVDVTIDIKNINEDKKVRYLGAAADGILDWEGSDHWDENGIGLISGNRTVRIDKVLSPGIHGITVGISSDTSWKALVNVEGVMVAGGEFNSSNPLTGVFLVIPRLRKNVQTPVIIRKLPGFILGYRKTGYQVPEKIKPENASIPRGAGAAAAGGGSPGGGSPGGRSAGKEETEKTKPKKTRKVSAGREGF